MQISPRSNRANCQRIQKRRKFYQKQIADLLLFADKEFELSETVEGSTVRQHLESAWRQSGIKPNALDQVDLPESTRHIWDYFIELCGARGSNGFGVNPISYAEIKSWSDLTGIITTPTEVAAIKQLDAIFLKYQAKQQSKKG